MNHKALKPRLINKSDPQSPAQKDHGQKAVHELLKHVFAPIR